MATIVEVRTALRALGLTFDQRPHGWKGLRLRCETGHVVDVTRRGRVHCHGPDAARLRHRLADHGIVDLRPWWLRWLRLPGPVGSATAWAIGVVRSRWFHTLFIALLAIVVMWAATLVFFYAIDGRTDSQCVGLKPMPPRNQGPLPGSRGGEPVPVTAPTTVPTIRFTTFRNAQTTTIPLTFGGDLPASIEDTQVVLESFSRDGVKVNLPLRYDVRRTGATAVLDVCVDSRPAEEEPEAPRSVSLAALTKDDLPGQEGFKDWLFGTADTPPGTYTARLHLHNADLRSEVILVEVTVQGRYLWLLIPAIGIMPFLAVFLVHHRWPENTRQLLIPTIAGGAAAAVVWNSQGFNDPRWGGIVPAFALLAAMYSAAVAAVSTLTKKDEPKPPDKKGDEANPGGGAGAAVADGADGPSERG